MERKTVAPRLAAEFKQIFGRSIGGYWCGFTGFDVVAFDDQLIRPADGVSTADAVRAQYGERAVELCRELMCAGTRAALAKVAA